MEYGFYTIPALAVVLSLLTSAQGQTKTEVTGVIGKSVKLQCDLPKTNPAQIRWVDWVHNTGRDAQTIYDGAQSADRTVDQSHPNRDNLVINDDYSLTIKSLRLGDDNYNGDAGEYICYSVQSDGTTQEKSFQVAIGGLPECSGTVELTEGETSLLSCEVPYSGALPQVEWYQGNDQLTSLDMNVINKARKEYTIAGASHEQHGKTFTCKMVFGDFTEECSLTVTVQSHNNDSVRDLKIMPENDQIRVDEEIRCTAMGNPPATINLTVTTAGKPQVKVTDGPNYKAFKVGKELEGQEVTVSCTASNKVGTKDNNINKMITYTVVEVKPNPGAGQGEGPGEKEGGNVVGIVAGVIIAALVIIVIVIAVVCIRRKNSKKHKGAKPVPTKEEEIKRMEDGKA